MSDLGYYFAELDGEGAVVSTFVDLPRQYPQFRFSSPELDFELERLPVKVVRVFRTPLPSVDPLQFPLNTGIKNVGGIWQETYEVKNFTNTSVINYISQYPALTTKDATDARFE